MRVPILLLGLAAISFPALVTRSETHRQTVLESSDSSFQIEEVSSDNEDEDTKIFVTSKANPNEKVLLMTQPSIWGGEWYNSPDSKWLSYAIREAHEVSSMQVFRRIEALKFNKVGEFSERAWSALSSKRKYTKGEEGIIDFVNWSPDNARLLIALRGPVHGDQDDKPWFTSWSVYFNLQTQKFEYSTYLERWNSQVFKSVSADDYMDRMDLAPGSAEPLADTISEEEWKKRQTEADRLLNETYHQLLAKLTGADAANLKSDEIAWIKRRDKITDEFAKEAAPPNPALRRLQSMVDLTNTRTGELKRRIDESTGGR
jgi:uncharacterized protein YecT (DUF1311 family)